MTGAEFHGVLVQYGLEALGKAFDERTRRLPIEGDRTPSLTECFEGHLRERMAQAATIYAFDAHHTADPAFIPSAPVPFTRLTGAVPDAADERCLDCMRDPCTCDGGGDLEEQLDRAIGDDDGETSAPIGSEDDGDALASAGLGTEEDYGDLCDTDGEP